MKISFEREVLGTNHNERIGLALSYGKYFGDTDRVFGISLYWNGGEYWFGVSISTNKEYEEEYEFDEPVYTGVEFSYEEDEEE